MSGDQWFELAKSIVFFSFWVAGAGIVIAVIGVFLGTFTSYRRDLDVEKKKETFGEMLQRFAEFAFKGVFDPNVEGTQKITALGLLIFFIGILLLVVSIIPALVGVVQNLIQGGVGGATNTPTPTPTST